MAVSSRKVQNKRDSNGVLTGKAGTVYDVNIKYTGQDGKKKSYAKKGFATKKEATQHEAEMKAKLANPVYSPVVASQGKQTVKEYLEEWVENHGKANLRPSTFAGYKSHIRNHIVPYIGHVQLNQLTPAMLDNMFQQLFDKGLSNSTVRYAQRILSVSMEHARKYRYIEHNPARDIITKFGKQVKTPDPYTIEQMQTFMSNVIGTEWEMPVVLAGMYGLRMSEIIGLRTTNIDLEKMQFGVVEQMPFKVPPGTKTITEMAPTKSNDRILPITEEALPYFLRQFDLIARQKALTEAGGGVYYDNKLFIAKPDGSPQRRDRMSANFGQLIRHLEMPHIRFHDLRHPYVKPTTKNITFDDWQNTWFYRVFLRLLCGLPQRSRVASVAHREVYTRSCQSLSGNKILFSSSSSSYHSIKYVLEFVDNLDALVWEYIYLLNQHIRKRVV